VAYLFKARTAEPEKQHSFLGNGRETDNGMSVARQQIINKQGQMAAAMERLDKRAPATTDKHATEEWCFLCGLH
jgi:hypothetical protein